MRRVRPVNGELGPESCRLPGTRTRSSSPLAGPASIEPRSSPRFGRHRRSIPPRFPHTRRHSRTSDIAAQCSSGDRAPASDGTAIRSGLVVPGAAPLVMLDDHPRVVDQLPPVCLPGTPARDPRPRSTERTARRTLRSGRSACGQQHECTDHKSTSCGPSPARRGRTGSSDQSAGGAETPGSSPRTCRGTSRAS